MILFYSFEKTIQHFCRLCYLTYCDRFVCFFFYLAKNFKLVSRQKKNNLCKFLVFQNVLCVSNVDAIAKQKKNQWCVFQLNNQQQPFNFKVIFFGNSKEKKNKDETVYFIYLQCMRCANAIGNYVKTFAGQTKAKTEKNDKKERRKIDAKKTKQD